MYCSVNAAWARRAMLSYLLIVSALLFPAEERFRVLRWKTLSSMLRLCCIVSIFEICTYFHFVVSYFHSPGVCHRLSVKLYLGELFNYTI